MSGGGGGPIIIHHAKTALSDPLVHGQLPQKVQNLIDPILAKEPGTWSGQDKRDVGSAFSWALNHIE